MPFSCSQSKTSLWALSVHLAKKQILQLLSEQNTPYFHPPNFRSKMECLLHEILRLIASVTHPSPSLLGKKNNSEHGLELLDDGENLWVVAILGDSPHAVLRHVLDGGHHLKD